MPQIRCPNCGTTINLEKRRENDFSLILKSIKSKERSFSELLKITKLPRKTLDLRLKQLLRENKIAKNANGLYCFNNGEGKFADSILNREIRWPSNKTLVSLLIIGLCVSATSLAFAMVIQPKRSEPLPLGYFSAEVKVENVSDLYTWQVSIKYNHSEIKVFKIIPGDFLGNDQVFANSTDSFPDMLMILGSLKGPVSGRSGSGTLATIIFGYFTVDYAKPEIIDESFCKTRLLDSNGCEIPFDICQSVNHRARLLLIFNENSG
jgi:hypothetical protein